MADEPKTQAELGSALRLAGADDLEAAIFAAGPDAMSIFDPVTKRILQVNDAWLSLYGYSRDEAVQMTVADVSAEPDLTRKAVEKATPQGGAAIELRWHKRKDGSVFPVELTAVVLRLGGKTVMYAVMRDISQRLREREALARSEARFRALIDTMPDGIVVHRDGLIVFMNRAVRAMLGYGPEGEPVGRPALELMHPDDRASVIERVRGLLLEGAAAPVAEERLVHVDGHVVSAEVTGLPVEFDGRPAVLAVVRDISSRKRMEAQLLMSDRLAALGRLAASVGHEINNPLAYVLGNVHLLRKDLESARTALAREIHESMALRVSIIEEGAVRVRDIVRDLKSLSVVERGQAEAAVDLHRVIDVCANMAEHEIRHRARLVRDYGAPAFVRASEARLGQVFLNLLINAGQSIPEGDAGENEVRVRTRLIEGRRVEVEVRDTGGGIPAELRERVFEPFFSTKGEGTGLGLSICQLVVSSLGGQVSIEPNVPRGSCFRVVLPAFDERTTAPPSSSSRPLPPPGGGDEPRRVLIVDDEAHVAAVLRDQLEGYDVTVRTGGRAALELLSRFDGFDAVLLDVRMDDVGGVEVFEHIRARYPALEPHVVFMTGGALPARAEALLGKVRNPCLQKPFDAETLRAAIERAARPRPSGGAGLP